MNTRNRTNVRGASSRQSRQLAPAPSYGHIPMAPPPAPTTLARPASALRNAVEANFNRIQEVNSAIAVLEETLSMVLVPQHPSGDSSAAAPAPMQPDSPAVCDLHQQGCMLELLTARIHTITNRVQA